jgi:hypothetical protein
VLVQREPRETRLQVEAPSLHPSEFWSLLIFLKARIALSITRLASPRLHNAEILVLHVLQLPEYLGLLSQKAQLDAKTADDVLEIAKKQAVVLPPKKRTRNARFSYCVIEGIG